MSALIDWDRMRGSLDRAAKTITELLREQPDASKKVPGLDWTVSELGAHLITEPRRFERFGRGVREDISDVAAFNAGELEAITERDPARQADIFWDAHRAYMELARKRAGTEPYMWFQAPMTWAEAAGIYLGELHVHSVDLARTVGRTHSVGREDALQIVYGLVPIVPMFVDQQRAQGFRGTFKVALRGGTPFLFRFEDGTLSVEPANGGRADCTISADPEAFLLVSYGRASQWGAIARGKLMAAGRKPWLGLRFKTLLVNP